MVFQGTVSKSMSGFKSRGRRKQSNWSGVTGRTSTLLPELDPTCKTQTALMFTVVQGFGMTCCRNLCPNVPRTKECSNLRFYVRPNSIHIIAGLERTI